MVITLLCSFNSLKDKTINPKDKMFNIMINGSNFGKSMMKKLGSTLCKTRLPRKEANKNKDVFNVL